MSSTTKSLVKFFVTGVWIEDNDGRVLTEAEKAYAMVRFEEQIGLRSSGILILPILPISLEIHFDGKNASLLLNGASILEGLAEGDQPLQFCYHGNDGYMRYFRVKHTFEP